MSNINTVQIPFGEGRELTLETGRIARQAHGTVTARIGDTLVMANVVRSNKPLDHMDFFPLMVDYREKHYAVGRIPGNFFRREGRPGTMETISARLIDRTIRPLFPKGFRYEVQVYITILAMDKVNSPEVPALIAASAALSISDIPFNGPVAATRIGMLDGKVVFNPTFEEREETQLDCILGGTPSAITMVESGSQLLTEDQILDAMEKGREQILRINQGIQELVDSCGKPKIDYAEPQLDEEIVQAVEEKAAPELEKVKDIVDKQEREEAVDGIRDAVVEALAKKFAPAEGEEARFPNLEKDTKEAFDKLYKGFVRRQVLDTGKRADGRKTDEIRPITVEVDYLPGAHGSAIFTRGQTQSLGVATLGSSGDQQKIDDLLGLSLERFMLHYNFPSYCVGETRRIMGPGRRELGHGNLARRSIEAILPTEEEFPYTLRLVSEITESNGSSSMASVCSCCLALMDAGVPIKAPVAGVAMGLIKEGDDVAILSDIMGMEDHLGDMDFKVAGTAEGISALQMDIKLADGLPFDILKQALAQAKAGRLHILGEMAKTLPETRPELSANAPRIEIVQIDPERIGDLIGPSGKHIRGIQAATECKIDVEEDGKVFICTADKDRMEMARQMVHDLTADVEMDKVYEGKVVRITDFGCFVELLPKKDGLVHISELDFHRVDKVEDICREGDIMKVKVIDIDPSGKVRLSRKAALMEEPGFEPPEGVDLTKSESPGRGGGGGGRGGGGRGGGRGGRGGSSGGGRERGGRDRGGRDRGGRDRGGR